MVLKQRLEHRQHAIMTQSLRQSIEILALPALELKETIEAELAENPVVEEVAKEPDQLSADDSQLDGSRERQEALLNEEESPIFDKEIPPKEFANYEKPLPGKKETLSDILLRQLRINAASEQEIHIGSCIIRHVDENGYLRQTTDFLCQEAGCQPQELENVLAIIQTFDPAGVGARDLKECLLIQLKRVAKDDALLFKLIGEHLEDLPFADIHKLSKKLRCSEDELREGIKRIQALEPKPGRRYFSEEVAYVIPDLTIEEKEGELTCAVKDEVLPVIRVSPAYKSMLRSGDVREDTKDFIRQRISSAGNLIRAIRHRRKTLLEVLSIIAQTQKEAILDGMEKLKPLTFKDVAEQVSIHESTVCRVVMHKYVQTPNGIFALKEFFSNGLKTSDGEDVSSQRIKLQIKELIDNEDKAHPLRDQKIAELIAESEKIQIARRTIAKYREVLKIPPVSQRRHKGLVACGL